jgi:hypothetical protein
MDREAAIVWVERGLDGTALGVGTALLVAAPALHAEITRPMLVVLAGVVLLASGLARDLARLALEDRPGATAPDGRPGELLLCVESTLGLLAVAAGLGGWFWQAGPVIPVPVGGLVLGGAVVAAFGHLTRNLVVVFRREANHRNVVFWSRPRGARQRARR